METPKPAQIGHVRQIDINEEMRGSYLDYAMSVIVSRALPDVRDGLKPVHRRILYAMYDMGLRPDRPYRKSARIVGEVLGKYHPHGDSAVYDAMVRMAQDFAMRYPLVDGQGNYGSVDGDAPAAMRYTEARLAPMAMEMLADIEKETVDFVDNFDGSLQEPTVLPATLPNLLINGAGGIAVGMATNIPPHNLGEVCDALCYLIDHYEQIEQVSAEDLMRFVKGPDFPTGGIVYRYRHDGRHQGTDTILNAYSTGRGHLVVQGRTHIEAMSRGRHRIVITELPYQVNKANLIERIAHLVREGKLNNITDLRDESDRQGMRVVIELSRNADPSQVLEQLFKLTPLRQTFGVIMLALVDGRPRTLTLKSALTLFLEHRIEVVRRRSEHELARARRRAHILEGLRIALDQIDAVIETIRRSRSSETAHRNLRRRFKLTDQQATAILEMPLRRLAALERRKVEAEYRETRTQIAHLEALLADPGKIRETIREELQRLKRTYGDQRRTRIVEAEYTGQVSQEELIADAEVVLTLGLKGEIARTVNAAHRPRSAGQFVLVQTAHNRHDLLVVTADGLGWQRPVHQVPQAPGTVPVTLGRWLSGFGRRSAVALVNVPRERPEALSLVLVSRQGRVMRVAGQDIASVTNGTRLFSLSSGDEVVWAGLSGEEEEEFLLLFTRAGRAIRFPLADVRPMGAGATGVLGMKLDSADDHIIGAGLSGQGPSAVLVSEHGYAKRVAVTEFPAQRRYGKGVVAFKISRRSGPPVAAAVLSDSDRLLLRTRRKGVLVSAADIPLRGRATAGTSIISVAQGDAVVSLCVWRHRAGGEARRSSSADHRATATRSGTRRSRSREERSAPSPQKGAGRPRRSTTGARRRNRR